MAQSWSGRLVCRKSDKLDWMYQGGMVAKAEANKRMEEQQAAQPAQPSNVSICVMPICSQYSRACLQISLHISSVPRNPRKGVQW